MIKDKEIVSFFSKTAILTLLLLTVGYFLFSIFNFKSEYKYFLTLVLFFFFISFAFFIVVLKILKKDKKSFVRNYMAISILKVLIYLIFIFIILFFTKINLKIFLISFLIVYLTYTIFDVLILNKIIRNRK